MLITLFLSRKCFIRNAKIEIYDCYFFSKKNLRNRIVFSRFSFSKVLLLTRDNFSNKRPMTKLFIESVREKPAHSGSGKNFLAEVNHFLKNMFLG